MRNCGRSAFSVGFNTQPRGGGCFLKEELASQGFVSTHSRAEAAAADHHNKLLSNFVSTHSRAEAAAPYLKKQEKSAD